MADIKVGKITHYFVNIQVAVLSADDAELKVGDRIKIIGHGKEFEQDVTSMQVNHENVDTAEKGSEVGMKVNEPVKEGDEVFKV